MKRVRYTKFTGDLASEIDLEDLLKALSDYLLAIHVQPAVAGRNAISGVSFSPIGALLGS